MASAIMPNHLFSLDSNWECDCGQPARLGLAWFGLAWPAHPILTSASGWDIQFIGPAPGSQLRSAGDIVAGGLGLKIKKFKVHHYGHGHRGLDALWRWWWTSSTACQGMDKLP